MTSNFSDKKQTSVERHGQISFYKFGAFAGGHSIILIPGGPWISGVYLDMLGAQLSQTMGANVYRAVLPNHEIDFNGPFKNLDFNSLIQLFRDGFKSLTIALDQKPILIGHSFGSIILSHSLIHEKIETKGMVLMSSPLSMNNWPNFDKKLHQYKVPSSAEIKDESSFKNWWWQAAPLYFASNFIEPKLRNRLANHTYMTGNTRQPTGVLGNQKFEHEKVNSFVSKKFLDLILIEGDQDPIGELNNLNGLQRIYGEKVKIIPESGHFPMLENPGKTLDVLKKFIERLDR